MLDRTISTAMHTMVGQRLDNFNAEESKKREALFKKEASSGFSMPQGSLYGGLFELHHDSIEKRADIVWNAAIKVLDAYKPSFYPEIAYDIKKELNSYFPESLSAPDNYRRRIGWSEPDEFSNEEDELSELEDIRHSSLLRLNTNIDLFAAIIKSKERRNNMQKQPVTISIHGSITNSPIAINSANANQVNFRINEIQPLINAIKESLNQAFSITEAERKTHLISVENLEKELAKPVQDKNFILKSLDSLASAANKVGTIVSSVESLKVLIAPFLS